MFVANETKGLYTSDEAYKMALTDALSVACKALGMGADVYWHGGTKYTEPDRAEAPKATQTAPTTDTASIFLTDVQYRVAKSESGVSPKTSKPYTRILLKEADHELTVYDNDAHKINEGDFIIIKEMKPITAKEYKGKTYYQTSATIALANHPLAEEVPLPFDI